ncbi:MAG: ribonuclease P protein component [Chryseolinea sp.]
MGQHDFRKEERLSKEKIIQELFAKGSSFYLYPFKVFFMNQPDQAIAGNQVLITVSKKLFSKAVDRNTIKRRIREGYRLNKNALILPKPLVIAYIYSVKEILPSAQLHERLVKTFKRFQNVEKN